MVTSASDTSARNTIVPGVIIRQISLEAPWDWISAGWRDMWMHPQISLSLGLTYFAMALLIFIGATQAGLQSLILALGGGFMIIAPLFAVSLYELSRRIEQSEPITFASIFWRRSKARGQIWFLGAVLAFFYYAWIQLAFLLFLLFFGGSGAFPPISEWVPTLLYKPHGLGLLITGTFLGAVLAAIAFSISVISLPLVMVHRIDAISAMHVSTKSVTQNLQPMVLWATLIAATMTVGMLTCFVGLIFIFPLIGHASWHAFRDVIELGATASSTN